MAQEVPKRLQKESQFRPQPDLAPPKAFNTEFLSALVLEFDHRGTSEIREIRVESYSPPEMGMGEPLNVGRRVAQYRSCASTDQLVQTFGMVVGRTRDARYTPPLDIVAAQHIGKIVDSARLALADVFDRTHPPQ